MAKKKTETASLIETFAEFKEDKNIDITFGVDDIQLPLHPGAEAFWKDTGYIK